MKKNKDLLVGVIFLVVAIVAPLILSNTYDQNVLILALMYAMVGSAWNILGGFAGQVSFGNGMFFAAGAYTSGALVTHFGISPWIGMIIGIIVSVALATLIGLPCFRLQGFYFNISTIALLQIMQVLLTKWEFVGGSVGLRIPLVKDSWVLFQFKDKLPYYYIILGLLVITLLVCRYVINSKAGYYLRAIKLNKDAAESLGVNTVFYKWLAIVVCAALTAVAGTFYAQYVLFLDPPSVLKPDMSLLFALVAVFGGVETLWGPVLGACILIPIAEYSRASLGGTGSGIDMIIYGALVLIMALYQPNGMIGLFKDIRKKLDKKKKKAGEKNA